jgi:hypothetical protein
MTKRRVRTALVMIMLAVHGSLLAWGATRHSFAWTEAGLLPSGLFHWKYGNFDTFRVNPPLLRMWATLPLLAMNPKLPDVAISTDPRRRSEWDLAQQFVDANKLYAFRCLAVARWMCIPFSLFGAWICFRWAGELYGANAGLGVLALWCFSPNMLAHGQMMTGDAAAAALGVTTFYVLRHWLRDPSWSLTYVLGCCIGFALTIKASWIILFGLVPLIWVLSRILEAQWNWRVWACEGVALGASVTLAVLVLNATYGFDGTGKRLGDYEFVSRALSGRVVSETATDWGSNRFASTWLSEIPVPLPEDFVLGLDVQKWDFDRPRWSYLRGEWQERGWWYYYLYAAAIKIPLGTWCLIVMAAVACCSAKGSLRDRVRDSLLWALPMLAIILMASSQTGLNKHFRYVLPAFPFLFLSVGSVFARGRSRIWRMLTSLALTWSIVSSLWIYPHALSYFNESVGGPLNGHRHLTSSNIDWGQDLLFLKAWYDRHPEARPLRVASYLRLVRPEAAGIEASPKPPYYTDDPDRRSDERNGPQPGWFAVDVGHLTREDGQYDFYDIWKPVGMAGYSFRIYHVTTASASALRAELGMPP